jgi:hypothetical protein
MQLSQRQIVAVFNAFAICQHQVLGAVIKPGNNQAHDNLSNGENTVGTHVDAPALIARASIENNEPSLVARGSSGKKSDKTSKPSSIEGESRVRWRREREQSEDERKRDKQVGR